MFPKTYLLLILSLSLLLTACQETEIVEVEIPVVIEPDFAEMDRSRDPYRRNFNMRVFADRLGIYGEHLDVSVDTAGASRGFLSNFTNSGQQAVNNDLRIFGNGLGITVRAADPDLNFSGTGFSYWLPDTIPDIRVPSEPWDRWGSVYLSPDNYFLLPYGRGNRAQQYFALGRIEANFPLLAAGGGIELADIKFITYDTANTFDLGVNGVEILPVADGFLYVRRPSASRSTIERINYAGDFETVLEFPLDQLFAYQGTVYGQRYNYASGQVEVYSADPDGRNWRLRYTFDQGIDQRWRMHPTGNDLFVNARISGQIFHVTEMDAERISLVALDSEQLHDYRITDMEVWQDEVYLTTLSGTFKRDYSEFLASRFEE